jgi:hypothetical protein
MCEGKGVSAARRSPAAMTRARETAMAAATARATESARGMARKEGW